jgi:carbonic anhydrase
MGHTHCGAIAATVEAIRTRQAFSKNIEDITKRIQPQIEALILAGDVDQDTLREAERVNVRGSVAQLQHGSAYLEARVQAGNIRIVGAIFELETGRVQVL